MQDAWIAFARTGSPRTPALPGWEPYAALRRCTMLLGTPNTSADSPYEAERRFREAATPAVVPASLPGG
jgi:para-nitrobenzyl esterase